jgi:hypothetical protein
MNLKEHDGPRRLFHLVNGIVHGRYKVLDIGSIKWRDECPPNCHQHFASHIVGFGLSLENLLAIRLDSVPASQRPTQRFSTCNDNPCVLREERKEALLSGHESLKPAKHGDISTWEVTNPNSALKLAPHRPDCIAVIASNLRKSPIDQGGRKRRWGGAWVR